jgi:DHA1 family tetracycline resistance protein-like MFS transporter
MKNKNTLIILILIFTVIIDIMGMGLVLPLMPSLFLTTPHSVFVEGHSSATHYFYYAIAMSAWPLGLFFGTPFLGDLSDRFGRRNILMLCLMGTALTYFLSGISAQYALLSIFLISRLLSGFFAGSYILAQAVMVDISPTDLRSRYLGWISMAASIGFVIGPVITSLTASSHFITWLSLETPFYIAAILSFINLASVALFLPETDTHRREVKLSLLSAVTLCSHIFRDQRTTILACSFLFMQVGWGFYVQDIPLILNQVFNLDVKYLGLFFAVLGLGVLTGVLFVQPVLLKYFSLKTLTIWTMVATCLILMASVVFPILSVQWLSAYLATIPELVGYTAVLTLLSKAVNDNEQGKIMGGTGAIYGASWFVNALLIGGLSNLGPYVPLMIGCVCYLLCAAFILKVKG